MLVKEALGYKYIMISQMLHSNKDHKQPYTDAMIYVYSPLSHSNLNK